MSESEQRRLYEHFSKTSKDGATDIIRANATTHAKEILESYPKFEVKVLEKVVEEPIEEPFHVEVDREELIIEPKVKPKEVKEEPKQIEVEEKPKLIEVEEKPKLIEVEEKPKLKEKKK